MMGEGGYSWLSYDYVFKGLTFFEFKIQHYGSCGAA